MQRNIQILDYKIQDGISTNGKVGLVLLATDYITNFEFSKIFKDSYILHIPSRLMNSNQITKESLIKIKNELVDSVNLIIPQIDLDVVAFSCTSATMTIGEKEVEKLIKSSNIKRKITSVTNPLTAAKKAFNELKIKKLDIITPYIDELTNDIINEIEKNNIEVCNSYSFKIPNDNIVPYISSSSIINSVLDLAKISKSDAIFISCTNINICSYIKFLEEATSKTILTSNQTMAWDIMKLCNYDTNKVTHFGKLFNRNI